MGSQKYGTLVGNNFGWRCSITLEQCNVATRTYSRKPECKGCKIAREFKMGIREAEKVPGDMEE